MSDAPLCAAPNPHPRAPRYTIPGGACDCHFHVSVGPSPLVPERSYTPPDLSITDYRHMRDTLGLSRGVIVQASPHGTDNRTTLAATGGDSDMLAVVVIGESTSHRDLLAMADQGAVGTRANLLFSSNAKLDDLTGLTHRIADVGWHLQMLCDVSRMDDFEELVRSSSVPIVIDHMGHVPASKGVAEPGFQTLLRLLDGGKVWVKLSGAYRLCDPPYAEAAPMAQALVVANPERLVWGCDWPHPAISGPMPEDGALLDLLFDWADPETAHQILVRNPEALYGFPKWENARG
ncbi:MAG: amidohydrolase family protein [Pseudomonadota bacterium]